MSQAMIDIRGLQYSYPQQNEPALRGIDWQVAAGEFVLVTGPSGAGKSTLLRCLNGLVPHFNGGTIAGQVWVNGLDVIAASPTVMSQHVGFVLQNPEAQAVLDVVEAEIAFGLENTAVPRPEMQQRVSDVLNWLDLTHLRQRQLHTLSGGERQRVAIATALALRPQVLVLDEPTSQLDPQSAEEVLQALVRLNQALGLTIILSEHRLARILPYAHRMVVVEDGRLVEDRGLETGDWRLEIAGEQRGRGAEGITPHASRFTLLDVKDLHFAYEGEPVLGGVNLQVGAGEAVALVGRNGTGKSTLLRCVVGLLQGGKGEVVVNGRSIHKRSVADICREVAYLPQNPDDLLFADTVADELAVTLKNHGLADAPGSRDLLAELGLAAYADAYPRDLSVGQRQRVALGAVTVTRPNILLLDEPTRGLDAAAKQNLVAIWQRWLARGMGLLLVTHDRELVAQVADRVLMMEDGMVKDVSGVQVEPPDIMMP
jgi:energy-coupling factor transport system ATP-binding protein